jgi:hypothetical protein
MFNGLIYVVVAAATAAAAEVCFSAIFINISTSNVSL